MAMSRRKQLHPKSLKEGDEANLVLPDELKCDEESNEIIARIDIEEGHRFGPFPATIILSSREQRLSSDSDLTNTNSTTMQIDNDTIEHRMQSFQLLDNKHNWLSKCSISNQISANLNIQFQDDQIFAIVTKSLPSGTNLYLNNSILPKLNHCEDLLQTKQEIKPMITNSTDEIIKVKEEPIESEENLPKTNDCNSTNVKAESPNSITKSREIKKSHPLVFTCEDCGIRYSNRSTLDAHREHYCTKREITKSHSTDSSMSTKTKGMKRKHNETTDSSPSSPATKRLSLSSNDAYCSECDILFSKPDNLLQHKLHYCRTKLSNLQLINEENSITSFRPTIPFDRPIQIGQFIYVPVPIVSSKVDNHERSVSPCNSEHDEQNKPLDLSKPKKLINETKPTNPSSSPLDLTMEKSTNLFNILNSTTPAAKAINSIQPQIYECDFCSIRFSSLKTLHAHQENYCIEYRKQKKPTILNNSINEMKSLINDTNRSQSPPLSSSTISKSLPLSPNESTNSSHLPPHRASPYMCRLCKYRGNTLRGMRMHFKFHLSNNEPCSDDDIIMTSTINNNNNTSLSITSTISSSSSSPQFLLKCTICSAMFEHEETLVNHIKCVHTKENLLECLECQSRFCSKWNLLRHMKLTHTNIKCEDDNDDGQDEHSITTHESQTNANGSNNDQKLDEDRDLSSPNEKSSDPVNLTRNVLFESMDINSIKKLSDNVLSKKKFACPYCHIKFGSFDTLKQHMTNYCSSRPTNDETNETKKKSNDTFCSSCQIPFRHKSSYDAHKTYYCRGSNKAHVKMQA